MKLREPATPSHRVAGSLAGWVGRRSALFRRGLLRDEPQRDRLASSDRRSCSPHFRGFAQQPQQTGVPFIMTQQVHPAFIMVAQQSQQA